MLYFIILFKKDGLFIKLCKSNLSIIHLSNLIQYFSKYQSGENIGKRNVIVFTIWVEYFWDIVQCTLHIERLSYKPSKSNLIQGGLLTKTISSVQAEILNMICLAVYYNVVKNIYVFELWHLSISFFLFCNIFIQIPSCQHNVIKIYHI